MRNQGHLFLFLICSNICFPQIVFGGQTDTTSQYIYYGSRHSTHPFGVLTSRINHSFQTIPSDRITLRAHVSSGNVWLPEVMAYEAMTQDDREYLSSFLWNDREFYFKENSMPATSRQFHADGVIRLYQLDLSFPLGDKHELSINTRAFSLDAGKVPFSLLTSDQFIEWFHSHIAGGEDPFARRAYGLNEARIRYQDPDHLLWEMNRGDFTLSGIELSYNYYPGFSMLAGRGLYTNFGSQLGINVSKANPSLDFSLSTSLLKTLVLKNNTELRFGLGLSATHFKLLSLGQGVELSDRELIMASEILVSYILPIRNKGHFSMAVTYFMQSSYFKKQAFDYVVLTGDRISSHWHYAISHFYKTLSASSFVLSYSQRALAYSLFIREDLLVNNAPDVQLGLGISFKF